MSDKITSNIAGQLQEILSSSVKDAMQSNRPTVMDANIDIVRHRWNTLKALVQLLPNSNPVLEDLMCVLMPSSTSESMFKMLCIEEITDNYMPSAKVLSAVFEDCPFNNNTGQSQFATANLYVKYKVPVGIYDIVVLLMMFHYRNKFYNIARSYLLHATSTEHNAEISNSIRNYSSKCLSYIEDTCPYVYSSIEKVYKYLSSNCINFLNICCVQQSQVWHKFEDSIGIISLEQSAAIGVLDLGVVAKGLDEISKLVDIVYSYIKMPLTKYIISTNNNTGACSIDENKSIVEFLSSLDLDNISTPSIITNVDASTSRIKNTNYRKNSRGIIEERIVVTVLGSSVEMWRENPELTDDSLYLSEDESDLDYDYTDSNVQQIQDQLYTEQLAVAAEFFGTSIQESSNSQVENGTIAGSLGAGNSSVVNSFVNNFIENAENRLNIANTVMNEYGNPETVVEQVNVLGEIEARTDQYEELRRISAHPIADYTNDTDEEGIDEEGIDEEGIDEEGIDEEDIDEEDIDENDVMDAQATEMRGHFINHNGGLLWVDDNVVTTSTTTTDNTDMPPGRFIEIDGSLTWVPDNNA